MTQQVSHRQIQIIGPFYWITDLISATSKWQGKKKKKDRTSLKDTKTDNTTKCNVWPLFESLSHSQL